MEKYLVPRKHKMESEGEASNSKQTPKKRKHHKYKFGYQSQQADSQSGNSRSLSKLNEVQGDLFSCPVSDSLAHCISADARMGKGIAVLFKNKFGGVEEIKSQGQKPGGVAILKKGERFVYYLVTKEKSFHKPTYKTLQSSLEAMRDHCLTHNVIGLSMPKIGCGLDGLQWYRVSGIIHQVFQDTNINVTVYSL
nr:ADP-ribose glycohydrolase OARD1-like isoform X1 [Pocillopora verrucosa]